MRMIAPNAPVKYFSYCASVVAVAQMSKTPSKTRRSATCESLSFSFWIFSSVGCRAM